MKASELLKKAREALHRNVWAKQDPITGEWSTTPECPWPEKAVIPTPPWYKRWYHNVRNYFTSVKLWMKCFPIPGRPWHDENEA